MKGHYFLGVDVGTGSARAAIFNEQGQRLALAKHEIQCWRPQPDFAQQSTEDIWAAICYCVRQVVAESEVDPAFVRGVGFDATCSLVVRDAEGAPVSVSPGGEPDQDVILWADHRAVKEADEINAGGYSVLKYVGGRISPEMEVPKILWLKRNQPETWKRAAAFFDLPDYLTWRATDASTRSLCSTVCKMTYLGHEEAVEEDSVGRWDASFFRDIGLEELADENFARLGQRVRPMGEAVGQGLTAKAADELGLSPGTAVSVSIIDAHAGGIGMLGVLTGEETQVQFDHRLALIGGTSSCHMAVSPEPRFLPGIWGPYYSAMVPGMWLNEGGQSAVGSLIDHVIFTHHASQELQDAAEEAGISPYALLNRRVDDLAAKEPFTAALARNLHVDPDFHGNRSPRADASLKGSIVGLSLSASLDDLTRLYLATLHAVAYGTRHIIETMNADGYSIDTVVMCGGHVQNERFIQAHADATGCRFVIPEEPEAVLLGGAILGSVAAGHFKSIPEAMAALTRPGREITPDPASRSFHDRKYQAFQRLHELQTDLRQLMAD